MPRPRIDEFYEERIATLAEEGYRPAGITRLLEIEAKEEGRQDWPSPRTVQHRYDQHSKSSEEDKRQAALVRWPQSMGNADLPWEASAAVLDLLRYRDENGLGRPKVRLAKWFWRITLAHPDSETVNRAAYAAFLAAWELVEGGSKKGTSAFDLEALELFLAYRPLQDESNAIAYKLALEPRGTPEQVFRPMVTLDMDTLGELLSDVFGEKGATDRLKDVLASRTRRPEGPNAPTQDTDAPKQPSRRVGRNPKAVTQA